MHANNYNMTFVFHENSTSLKMEDKEVEETFKTINFSYFIMKRPLKQLISLISSSNLKFQSIELEYVFT